MIPLPPGGSSLAGGGREGIEGRGEERRGEGIGNGVFPKVGLVLTLGGGTGR